MILLNAQTRQEAYELQALRRKKADDHRMKQIQDSIKLKDEKYEAIQKGQRTLYFMREKMKDIVNRASVELNDEMRRLQHKGHFNPDLVIERAIAVSDKVLFPRWVIFILSVHTNLKIIWICKLLFYLFIYLFIFFGYNSLQKTFGFEEDEDHKEFLLLQIECGKCSTRHRAFFLSPAIEPSRQTRRRWQTRSIEIAK